MVEFREQRDLEAENPDEDKVVNGHAGLTYAESRTTLEDLLLMSLHQTVVWHDEKIYPRKHRALQTWTHTCIRCRSDVFWRADGLENGTFGL